MTWNSSSTVSRNNEVLYHKLNLADKKEYLVHKYFTPQNWLNLYSAYWPNLKEFSNNAFWRLNSDIFLDHYYKGVIDPFVKEPAYAVFNLFPMIYATTFQVPIGSSNNTFTSAHLSFTALRAMGKFAPYIIYSEQRNEKGALDKPVKIAQYLTDTICRWIPYSNERLQSDNTTDVYSKGFFAISVNSGIARTIGSEISSPYANSIQNLAKNVLINTIANPLSINIEESTFSKINALKDILLTGSYTTQAQEKAVKVIEAIKVIKESPIDNMLNIPFIFISKSISPLLFIYTKTTENLQTAINYVASPIIKIATPYVPKIFFKPIKEPISLEKASQKGAIFIASAIIFDLAKLIVTNFIGTFISAPSSRIVGIFAEETTEFANELTDLLIGNTKNIPDLGYSGESATYTENTSDEF